MLIETSRRKASRLTPLLVAVYLLGLLLPCSVATAGNSGHCVPIVSEAEIGLERAAVNPVDAHIDSVVDHQAPARSCCNVMCALFIRVAALDATAEIRPSVEATPPIEGKFVGTAPKRLIRPPISSVSL
jgi:hypothetical protein